MICFWLTNIYFTVYKISVAYTQIISLQLYCHAFGSQCRTPSGYHTQSEAREFNQYLVTTLFDLRVNKRRKHTLSVKQLLFLFPQHQPLQFLLPPNCITICASIGIPRRDIVEIAFRLTVGNQIPHSVVSAPKDPNHLYINRVNKLSARNSMYTIISDRCGKLFNKSENESFSRFLKTNI